MHLMIQWCRFDGVNLHQSPIIYSNNSNSPSLSLSLFLLISTWTTVSHLSALLTAPHSHRCCQLPIDAHTCPLLLPQQYQKRKTKTLKLETSTIHQRLKTLSMTETLKIKYGLDGRKLLLRKNYDILPVKEIYVRHKGNYLHFYFGFFQLTVKIMQAFVTCNHFTSH